MGVRLVNNRLLVDGKPFFMLGMYAHTAKPEDLKEIADMGFNTVLDYRMPTYEYLDEANALGLKVIYSLVTLYVANQYHPPEIKVLEDEEKAVKDQVSAFKNHPALLAWYLSDDDAPSLFSRIRLHHKWVKEEDPYHPTYLVNWRIADLAFLQGDYDIFGSHFYSIGRPELNIVNVLEWAKRTKRNVKKMLWQVIQAHNLRLYNEKHGRTPTEDEIETLAWMSIFGCMPDCQGVLMYSHFDIKKDPNTDPKVTFDRVKRVNEKISRVGNLVVNQY